MNAILTKNVTIAVLWNGIWCAAVIDHKAGVTTLLAAELVMFDGLDTRCLGVPGLVSIFEDD